MIRELDRLDIFQGTSFSMANFTAAMNRLGIPWPRYPRGQPILKDTAGVARHPQFNLKTMLAHRATADVALLKLKVPHAGYIAPLHPLRPRVAVGERAQLRRPPGHPGRQGRPEDCYWQLRTRNDVSSGDAIFGNCPTSRATGADGDAVRQNLSHWRRGTSSGGITGWLKNRPTDATVFPHNDQGFDRRKL
jgi:hypothetical protein